MTASSSRRRAPDTTPIGYAAAVDLLRSRGRFGISLGLQRVTALLDELDHPERGLRGALVGGTNGKGRVVALALAVLGGAGPLRAGGPAVGVPLRLAGSRRPYRAVVRQADWDGVILDATTPAGVLNGLRVGLLGGHQAANAAVALALLDALCGDAARRGVALPIH